MQILSSEYWRGISRFILPVKYNIGGLQMKISFATIVIFLLIFNLNAAGKLYVDIGAGIMGTSEGYSLMIDLTSLEYKNNWLISGGLFAILGSEKWTPDNLHDYPCPDDDFTIIGKRRDNLEYGGVFRFGTNLGFTQNLHIYGMVGWSFLAVYQISESDGKYYTEGSDLLGKGSFGAGFSINIRHNKNYIFSEIDYRRGIVLGIGFKGSSNE